MAATLSKQELYLTFAECAIIGTNETAREEIQVDEINLTESLLNPGLQTNVKLVSKLDHDPIKDLNEYYGAVLDLKISRPIIDFYKDQLNGRDDRQATSQDIRSTLGVSQLIYRLSNRKRTNYQLERLEFDACDPSLILDAKQYISRIWNCVPPDSIVQDILRDYIKAGNTDVEKTAMKRYYKAENVHPFQAIYQQSEVALSSSAMDPSFVHYMTYLNGGTHHFRSLTALAKQDPVCTFAYSGKASSNINYANPFDIMDYEFPCDFDLLSDVLNGYDENGKDITSVITFNPLNGLFGQTGKGATPFFASTTAGTEAMQNSCDPNIDKYLVKRKPRMALLDQDKIALRLTVPFSPFLHVGNVIEAIIPNKETNEPNYGSGKYLISNMTHNIKYGGLGITILECVSNTVAAGRV